MGKIFSINHQRIRIKLYVFSFFADSIINGGVRPARSIRLAGYEIYAPNRTILVPLGAGHAHFVMFFHGDDLLKRG
jgi:hypothetical protein